MKLLQISLAGLLTTVIAHPHEDDDDATIDEVCEFLEDKSTCTKFGVTSNDDGSRSDGLCTWLPGSETCVSHIGDDADDDVYCSVMDGVRGKCHNDDRCAYDNATGSCIPADDATCRVNDGWKKGCREDAQGCNYIGDLCCSASDPISTCPELASIECPIQDDTACKGFSDASICEFYRGNLFFNGEKESVTECRYPGGEAPADAPGTVTAPPTAPPTVPPTTTTTVFVEARKVSFYPNLSMTWYENLRMCERKGGWIPNVTNFDDYNLIYRHNWSIGSAGSWLHSWAAPTQTGVWGSPTWDEFDSEYWSAGEPSGCSTCDCALYTPENDRGFIAVPCSFMANAMCVFEDYIAFNVGLGIE